MPRFFNTAGPCSPERHYMLAPETRLPGIRELIDRQHYFVLHAPRQSGKTTLVRTLAGTLLEEGRYTVVYASCETAQTAGSDLERGVSAVIQALAAPAERLPAGLGPEPLSELPDVGAESRLVLYLSRWAERSSRPLVLFLDEIDALRDEMLLLVLPQLRAGYPERPRRFPQSIALIGLRDVRDYRIRRRQEGESPRLFPPFNIKGESLTLRNFTLEEVGELYGQHTADTGQVFTPEATTLAWELTHGQPWLVNALAAEVVERLLPDRFIAVEPQHMEQAKEILVDRRNAHLDSLLESLREPSVRRVLDPILAGGLLPPDLPEDDLQLVLDLGLLARGPDGLQVANPIYLETMLAL